MHLWPRCRPGSIRDGCSTGPSRRSGPPVDSSAVNEMTHRPEGRWVTRGTEVLGDWALRVLPDGRRLRCGAAGTSSVRRLAPADDLEEEGGEDCDCCDREADCRVGRELADLSPAVGVEQHAAKRGALEDRCHFTCKLGVVGRSLCGSAQLRVGLAAGDLAEMDVDEVVRVNLGLLTGEELLAGVLGHCRRIRLRKSGDLRRARCREVDLLSGELVVHGRRREVARPEGEPAHEREDADQSDLQYEDPPTKSACHVRVPLMLCGSQDPLTLMHIVGPDHVAATEPQATTFPGWIPMARGPYVHQGPVTSGPPACQRRRRTSVSAWRRHGARRMRTSTATAPLGEAMSGLRSISATWGTSSARRATRSSTSSTAATSHLGAPR